MDLRHILNSSPEPNEALRTLRTNYDLMKQERLPSTLPQGSLPPRLFLSPRRLDPETSSVSTTSSSKRRRTNPSKVDIDRTPTSQSAAMGRSFSQLSVPSDCPTDDEDQATIKHGVAQLSLLGTALRRNKSYLCRQAGFTPTWNTSGSTQARNARNMVYR